MLCGRRENLLGFLGAESYAIAEHVHKLGEFLFSDGWHHLFTDGLDVRS